MAGLRVAWAALLTALVTLLLVGCSATAERVRVNPKGADSAETAPAITPDLAARILQRYLVAMRRPDASAIDVVEAGAARLVHKELRPLGADLGADALDVADLAAHYAIPRISGYPKWFAAGAVDAGMTGTVAIFVRTGPEAGWRAHRVVRLTLPMPELSRDTAGYVSVAQPGETAAGQAEALLDGGDDAVTTPVADALRRNRNLFGGAGWTIGQKIVPQGKAYALRAKDGGVVVWYVLDYTFSASNPARKYEVTLSGEAARLLGAAVVRRELVWRALYQSMAHVTPSGRASVLGISLPGWIRMTGG